jgi:hypothetical protein
VLDGVRAVRVEAVRNIVHIAWWLYMQKIKFLWACCTTHQQLYDQRRKCTAYLFQLSGLLRSLGGTGSFDWLRIRTSYQSEGRTGQEQR